MAYDFDELLGDGPAPDAALRQSFHVASQTDPNSAAEAQRLAASQRVPVDVAQRNAPELKRQAQFEGYDFDALLSDAPKAAAWLGDPNNASVAVDDLPAIMDTEKAIRKHGAGNVLGKALMKGFSDVGLGTARIPGYVGTLGDALNKGYDQRPEELKRATRELMFNNPLTDPFKAASEYWTTPELNPQLIKNIKAGKLGAAGEDLLYHVATNTPQMLTSMIAGFGGAAVRAASLAQMGGSTAATATGESLEQGFGPETAVVRGTLHGAAEVGFEYASFGLLKPWEEAIANAVGKDAAKRVLGDMAKAFVANSVGEGSEEVNTTIAQALTDYWLGVDKDALKNLDEKAMESFLVGAAMGGGMQAPAVVGAGMARGAEIRKAEAAKKTYLEVGQLATNSELRKRLPEKYQQLMQNQFDGTDLENVHVPVQAFEEYAAKSGLDPMASMLELGFQEEYAHAKSTGGDIVVPHAAWLTKLADTPHYAALADDIRYSADTLTPKELAEEMSAADQAAQAGAPAEMPQTMDAPAQVGEIVKEMLLQTGEEPGRAAAQAKIWEQRYRARAERRGLDATSATDLLKQWPLRIQREGVDLSFDTAAFEAQAQEEKAQTEAAYNLEAEKELAKAGGLTPLADAVRELGGLDVENMKAAGERAELQDMNHFFKPGGLSPDRMVMALQELGTLMQAQGITTPGELFEALRQERIAVENYKHDKGKGDSKAGEAALARLQRLKKKLAQGPLNDVAKSATSGNMELSSVPTPDEVEALKAEIERLKQELGEERYLRRTSPLTGLPNKLAFEEDQAADPTDHVVAFDLSNFKAYNTLLGHTAVDEQVFPELGLVLRKAAGELGLNIYHRSGDEFIATNPAGSEAESRVKMAQLVMRMKDIGLDVRGMTKDNEKVRYIVTGIPPVYGIGENYESADAKALGESARRRSLPVDDPDHLEDLRQAHGVPNNFHRIDLDGEVPAGLARAIERHRQDVQSFAGNPAGLKPAQAIRGAIRLNQAGRADQTQTPEFKAWFGDSKVVDEQGRPLVVYHGTDKNFDVFENKGGKVQMLFSVFDVDRQGFFFSPSENVAKQFGDKAMPVYLKIENPADLRHRGEAWRSGAYDKVFKELLDIGIDASKMPGNEIWELFDEEHGKQFVEGLKKLGYDGVIFDEPGSDNKWEAPAYVAFSPTQIKSATGNRGTFDANDPNILNQPAIPAPTWYSKLVQVIEAKMPALAPVAQVQGMTKEISADERKWLGLDEFLKGKDKVSKPELLEFLSANMPQVQEVVKGDMAEAKVEERYQEILARFRDDLAREPTAREMASMREDAKNDVAEELENDSDTKFGEYQLPGGENYREVLFTLPPKADVDEPAQLAALRAAAKSADGLDSEEKGLLAYLEKKEKAGTLERSLDTRNAFKSSHWDEANVLAHVRLNDRADADGKRVLFVEEIQSDWHQKGRKEGYRNDEALAQAKAAYDKANADFIEADRLVTGKDQFSQKNIDRMRPFGQARSEAEENYKAALNASVPDAPFRKTWHEFAFKRILRMAAEGGYDRVAWTTGEQQAERYDLSKQLSKVKAWRAPDNTWRVTADNKDGREVINEFADTDADLEAMVGKDLAKKIVEGNGGEFSGLDLKVGGEGMKGFYDKILVDFAGKFGKKFGAVVGKVIVGGKEKNYQISHEQGAITNEKRYVVYDMTEKGNFKKIGEYINRTAAEAWISEQKNHGEKYGTQVHSLDITPALRDAALAQGFSMFQDPRRGKEARGSIRISDDETLITLGRTADASTFLHESWHRWFFEMAEDAEYVQKQAHQKVADRFGLPVEAVREIASAKPEALVAKYKAALEAPNNGETPADFKRYPLSSVAMMDFGGDYENRYVEFLREFNPADLAMSEAEQGIKQHPSYARYVGWSKQGIEPPYISVAETDKGTLVSSNRRRTLVAQELGTPIKGWFGPHNKETGNPLKYGDVLKALGEAMSPTQQRLLDDFNALLKEVGAKDWASMTEAQQEQLAKWGEAYIMEGKAPSAELRTAMQQFRAWLVSFYRNMTALLQGQQPLTPEIQGILDRMLATDEQIAAAQAELEAAPLPGLENDPAYARALDEAREAAERELSTKVMAEWARERAAWWKDEREKLVKESIARHGKERVYKALAFLQHGTLPDGSPLPEGTPTFKLDKESIVGLFGSLRLPRARPYVYQAEGGMDVETAAELMGFSSADEMLTALDEAVPLKKLAAEEADAEMKALHGDMMLDGTMADEARKAVHNDKRAQLLRMEFKHLASQDLPKLKGLVRKVANRMPSEAALRAQVQTIIGRRAVKDIKPINYQRAESKARREAVDLLLKGDVQGAMAAKQKEMLNHELYRAAVVAREEVDALAEHMRKLQKPSVRERIGKAGGEYLDQLDALAERYSFAPVSIKSLERQASLREFLAKMDEQNTPVDVPEAVLNEARQVSYKEVPYEELVGLRDTVLQIEHLAKLKNKLLKAGRMRELDAAIDESTSSIEANSKGPRPKEVETRLPQDELLRAGAGFLASHRKMSSLLRQMDGFKDGGIMWELLMRPLNEAGNAEAVANEKATKELKAIFDAYGVADIAKMYRKEYIPGANTSLTKMGQLMVALNWGNEDNRQKLMDGYGWEQAQVQAVLDRLDERDWKTVQAIWDYIDSYWPETEAMSKRVKGVAPEKVQPAPVSTRFGTFKGGYFPLKYDDRQEPKAFAHLAEEAAKRAMGAGTVRSSTKQGHRKARVEGVKMPVRLDFGVIFEHVAEVIHDQTHYETLIDMNKLLGDRRLQSAIITHHGDQVYRQLTGAVNDIAAGNVPAQQSMERAINYLRVGTTISGLGWNLLTSMMQPLGLTQSMVRIGPKWVAKGLGRVLGDAKRMENTAAWIYEKSDFMRLRGKTQQREINEVRNELRLRGKLSSVEDSFFWLIAKGQQLVDIPTWAGAYEKAMADAETDPDVGAMTPEDQEKWAVEQADQAVLDSQGGGQVKDLAQIQRGGPLLKLWTNFYSFFNTTYNLAVESVGRTKWKSPASVGRLGVDMLLLYVAPAMMAMALREAVKGSDDDDDLLEKYIREQVAYIMGSMVLVREVSSAVQGFRGYEGPAGTRAFAEAGRLVKQVEQGDVDEAMLRSLNNVAGILFHYPAGQVDRTVRGTLAASEGQAGPQAALFGPPRK